MKYHRMNTKPSAIRLTLIKAVKMTGFTLLAALMATPALADGPQNVKPDAGLVVPVDQAQSLPATPLFRTPDAIDRSTRDVATSISGRVVIEKDFGFTTEYERAATYDIEGGGEAFIRAEKSEQVDLRDYNDRAVTPEGRYIEPLVSSASVGVRSKF